MKPKAISEDTRNAILDVVWRLLTETRRSELSQAEIAAAAGVSRQTVFYAFGNRAKLLTAALRHRDETLPYVGRLKATRAAPDVTPQVVLDYVGHWLDYLPHVYPVAALLHAAALTDSDAREAIDDRLVGALLGGLRGMVRGLAGTSGLPGRRAPDRVAEDIWAATHVEAWRLLVVERGWSPDEFRGTRLDMVRRLIGG